MVAQAAAGDGRPQSRPLDESDAAPTPPGAGGDDAGADGEPSAKKRKLAASSRGVANLTPEQLAKKRANDREAQRAIRERTKNQIQTLERRVEELTSLQPYQELQAAIEAKAVLERENAEIRQRLATVVGMLQPLIGQLPESMAATTEHQGKRSTRETAEPDRRAHSPAGRPTAAGSGTPTLPATGHHAAQSDLDQQREQLRHGLAMGPERLGLGFLLDASHQVSRIPGSSSTTTAAASAVNTPPAYRYPAAPALRQASVAPSSSGGASPNPSSSSVPPPPPPPPSSYSNSAFPSGYPYQGPDATADRADDASNADETIIASSTSSGVPRYAAPVRTTPPTCPLDSLLLDFLHERRQRAAEGAPAHEVLGPRYPSVSSLLNPARSAHAHPVSRVFTDILAKFPDLSGLPERVAVLYIMFLLMRWQVAPTRENYERLPRWARPLRAQLLTPHPAWIDHLPFPRMREALVESSRSNPDAYPFEHFFIPYTTTLTLSWPYHDTDTLLQSPHSEELMINPVFERHLRNLENWKLGEAFARALPGLAETGNVPERDLVAARAKTANQGGYKQSPGI